MSKTGIIEYKRCKTSVAELLDRYTIIKTSLNQSKQRRGFLNRRSPVRIRPAPPACSFRFSELSAHGDLSRQVQNPNCSKFAVVRCTFLVLKLLWEGHAAEEGLEAEILELKVYRKLRQAFFGESCGSGACHFNPSTT